MVAAALGSRRGNWPAWLGELSVAVRTDSAGELVDDFQTINPKEENLEYQQRMYVLLTGKRWSKSTHFTPDGQNLTSIVRRTYLSGAEFIVALQTNDSAAEVAEALRRPEFVTYLGRKAFAPVFPYYLGTGDADLLASLPTLSRDWDTRGNPDHKSQTRTKTLRVDTAKPVATYPTDVSEGTISQRTIREQPLENATLQFDVPVVGREEWREQVQRLLNR